MVAPYLPLATQTPVDVFVIVNQKIGTWKQDIQKDLSAIEAWVSDLVTQTREQAKKKRVRCEVCGSKEDASNLERHHIAGRKHDFRVVTVCTKRCHRQLSLRQGLWDSRWLQEGQPEDVRKAFFLLGLREVLLLKAEVTGAGIYTSLADAYIWEIGRLLGERSDG